MNVAFDSEFFRQPEVVGVMVGMLLSVLLLFGLYHWKNTVQHEQEQKILALQQEIERTRPPADTPETDWQRIMRETAAKQRIYWGAKLMRLVAYLPEEIWLRDISFTDAVVNRNEKTGENGLTVTGALYASDSELNLETLGDYIIECFGNDALMADLDWWKLTSITRGSRHVIDFTLNSKKKEMMQ